MHVCPVVYYQDGKGETVCKACEVDTYSDEAGRSSKADCKACSNDRSTGGSSASTNESSCLCKRDLYYSGVDGSCIPCPDGADCSSKDGLTLSELSALPGFWRPGAEIEIFASCAEGYSSLDAHEVAKQRCCPMNSMNVSQCARNGSGIEDTDSQCKAGYSGALCLVCADGYVKQGYSCIPCPGGATISMAVIPLVVTWITLFLVLLMSFACGKKATSSAQNARQWFGQAKIMLVSCGFDLVLLCLPASFHHSNCNKCSYTDDSLFFIYLSYAL